MICLGRCFFGLGIVLCKSMVSCSVEMSESRLLSCVIVVSLLMFSVIVLVICFMLFVSVLFVSRGCVL